MRPQRYNITPEAVQLDTRTGITRINIEEADNGEWIRAEDFDVERRHKDSYFRRYETEARLRIECLKGIKKLQRQRSELRIELLQNKHAAENFLRLMTEPRVHSAQDKLKPVTKEVCIHCEHENIAGTQCCEEWDGQTYNMMKNVRA